MLKVWRNMKANGRKRVIILVDMVYLGFFYFCDCFIFFYSKISLWNSSIVYIVWIWVWFYITYTLLPPHDGRFEQHSKYRYCSDEVKWRTLGEENNMLNICKKNVFGLFYLGCNNASSALHCVSSEHRHLTLYIFLTIENIYPLSVLLGRGYFFIFIREKYITSDACGCECSNWTHVHAWAGPKFYLAAAKNLSVIY